MLKHALQVDFLIAGAQKGGAAALDLYLREHPQVCMTNRKEVHVYDRDKHLPGRFLPFWSAAATIRGWMSLAKNF